MSPEPLTPEQIAALRPSRGRLKFIADALKTYSAVLAGAAVVTPAFSGHTVPTVNLGWAAIAFLLLAIGAIIFPEE